MKDNQFEKRTACDGEAPERFTMTTAKEVVAIFKTLVAAESVRDSASGSQAWREACLATAWEIWRDNRDREDNASRDQSMLAAMMQRHEGLPVNLPGPGAGVGMPGMGLAAYPPPGDRDEVADAPAEPANPGMTGPRSFGRSTKG